VLDLARQPLAGANLEPRPLQVSPQADRAKRRRQPRVVGADDELAVQRGGRQQHRVERPGDVRRPLAHQSRRQHVQLALGKAADQVAPRRGRREAPQQRQVRLRRGQRPRRRVHDHADVLRHDVEHPDDALARALQHREQLCHVVVVTQLVARVEVR
jgi:hypothetical protein